MATYVIHKFSNNPWILQSEILDHLKIDNSTLLTLNDINRSSKLFQNIILKRGNRKKYWNSIIPFAKSTDLVLDKKTSLPKRIVIFPEYLVCFFVDFAEEINLPNTQCRLWELVHKCLKIFLRRQKIILFIQ